MQSKDSSKFYVMDLDEECHLKNVCWANARRYETFGYVVTFDTIYLDKYNMPFASSKGLIIMAHDIARLWLLSSEDIDAFIWLFES